MLKNKAHTNESKPRDRCPLCGESNRCQSEMSQPCGAEHCWCYLQSFPADLLSQLPADERGQRCICQRCVEMHRAKVSAS